MGLRPKDARARRGGINNSTGRLVQLSARHGRTSTSSATTKTTLLFLVALLVSLACHLPSASASPFPIEEDASTTTTTTAPAEEHHPLSRYYQHSPHLHELLPTGHTTWEVSKNVADVENSDWNIVVLNEDISDEQVRDHFAWLATVLSKDDVKNDTLLHCVFEQGYAAKLTPAIRTQLKEKPEVKLVEPDTIYRLDLSERYSDNNNNLASRQVAGINDGLVWGLDRIDQASLPLDGVLNAAGPVGEGVDVYILDSGIRETHSEFGGRARLGAVFSAERADPIGHGTHVAGIVGGSTVGVAPKANLIAVKVIDNDGSGAASSVIMGLEWVTGEFRRTRRPSVINMSIGGGRSTALDMAVLRTVRAGITVVAAAGNADQDACLESPANLINVITVGASTPDDGKARFSNHGTCVDIFAPGFQVKSSWIDSDTAYKNLDGTSMASPATAGAAALVLAQNPNLSPAQVKQALIDNAVPGVLSGVSPSTPNLLLNVQFIYNQAKTGAALFPGTSSGTPASNNRVVPEQQRQAGAGAARSDAPARYLDGSRLAILSLAVSAVVASVMICI
ncbi:hypothetical protein HDU85_001683 [Gaertneriomyces sp. JEL0708]|nr:hypothetical protein HDU85_001683 [Gaertneriomyces sp. JEL0708]